MVRILKGSERGKGLARVFHVMEELMFRITKGPRVLRRPLDSMNSLLWELCDGSRRFEEICDLMDSAFEESIAPVQERTQAAIIQLEALGFLAVLPQLFDRGWPTGPGVSPRGLLLPPADERPDLDTNPLGSESVHWGDEEEGITQPR